MTRKKLLLFVAFLLTGSMTFGAWDSGITTPWNQGLSLYPSQVAPALALTYPDSTVTATNVDIDCYSSAVPGCVAIQEITSMVTDTSAYMLATTIDFDNNTDKMSEIGLAACMGGTADLLNGYVLGMNPGRFNSQVQQ